MRTLAGVVVVIAVASGCGSKRDDKKAPAPGSAEAGSDSPTEVSPDPGAQAPVVAPRGSRAATVDLTFTGAVTAKLAGAGGTCTCDADGARFHLRSSELKSPSVFELNILVTTPDEWTEPSILLNASAPARGSFARNRVKHRPQDKLSIARDCSLVTLDDVVLRGVASRGDVAVKGTITCAP